MDDLKFINIQEAKLQKEILEDHKKSIMRVKEIEMKNHIDTKMVNTKQMVKKLNDLDPYETMHKFNYKGETEEQIEESLENLNFLLAQNSKPEAEKKKAYKKMADKLNIRLDSTSPVRQKPQDKANLNPFAYIPAQEDEHVPNFKPRSIIHSTGGMSEFPKAESVISKVTAPVKESKLLKKFQGISGSYLNAEALKEIDNEGSFGEYQEVSDQISIDQNSKVGGKFRRNKKLTSQNATRRPLDYQGDIGSSLNKKKGPTVTKEYNDEYEDDFEELPESSAPQYRIH